MNELCERSRNVCESCTCHDRLKTKEFCFSSYTTLLNHLFINHFFGFSIIVQKNRMTQVVSCEQALIKTNMKPIEKHQSKTLLLFKTYTLEFEFDRHLEDTVSYQGMQSGLPVFLVGEFDTFSRFFVQNYCLVKPDFSYFSNYKHSK